MLPSKERLNTKQFEEVMKKGRVTHSSLFLLRAMPSPGRTKISAVVSKKTEPKATGRNKLRRQMYEAVRPLIGQMATPVMAIVSVKSAKKIEFAAIAESMKEIFVKAGLIR